MAAASSSGLVCVRCGAEAPHLYRQFGGGDSNIRLSMCGGCGGVVDRYVEFETLLVVLDLALHRPDAYRHVLINRAGAGGGFAVSAVVRLLPFYVVLDAFVKWSRVHAAGAGTAWGGGGVEAQLAVLAALALAEFVVYVACVQLMAPAAGRRQRGAAALAVGLSSFGKLLTFLAMVWSYEPGFASAIHVFVLTSNATALAAIDGDGGGGPWRAAGVVAAAWTVKTAFSWACAAAAGLPPGSAAAVV